MKPIRVEPEAKQELAAAAVWHEHRRERLGLELVEEVDAVFAANRSQPEPVPALPGLPIRVLATAHQRRRPGYWVARLTRR